MTSTKTKRLKSIRLIISSQEIGNQEELLIKLREEGYYLTQATLSRDLKQLKVAKAAGSDGKYVYVLPNDTMYRRYPDVQISSKEMMHLSGFKSLEFSGSLAIIKTRPGYASSLAYDIDNSDIEEVLGTIAGDDTILVILRDGTSRKTIKHALSSLLGEVK
jgi:transcriptional regulator of arginine metabolism